MEIGTCHLVPALGRFFLKDFLLLLLLFSSFPSMPSLVILELCVASNCEVMVTPECDFFWLPFVPCWKTRWKLPFLTARDWMGSLGSLQGAPFAEACAGIHSPPEDAGLQLPPARTAQPRRRWADHGCVDLRERPGKTLDYGSLSTCLPALSTCQNSPSQNPLSKEFFLMEFCTLKTITYAISAIKKFTLQQ